MRSTKSRVLTLSVLLAFGFVQVFGSGIAPAAYQLVLQAGIALARRTQINFIGAGVTCVDNAGLTRTDCTIPGSSYLFSSTADATNAAVAEATVIGAGSGSLTLAANYFGTAGNPLIVSAAGHYSTPVAPGTLRIRLKIGAATVLDTGAFVPQPSLVQQVWTLEARVVSRAVGAGGTVMVQSQFHPGAGAPVGQDWPLLNTAAVALDTTAANAVALTAEWSAAGGETITGTNFLMYGVTGASIPTPVGYATIQQATVPLTQRQVVNFTGAGVTCVDNAGATRTDCTVAGGGGVTTKQNLTATRLYGTTYQNTGSTPIFVSVTGNTTVANEQLYANVEAATPPTVIVVVQSNPSTVTNNSSIFFIVMPGEYYLVDWFNGVKVIVAWFEWK